MLHHPVFKIVDMTQGIFNISKARRPTAIGFGWTAELIWRCSPNPKKLAPFDHAFAHTVDANNMISSGISSLFLWCCPSAISRPVVAIYIDSINRMRSAWSRSHILVKRFEAVLPAIAYRDATSSIMGKTFRIFVFTSGFYFAPSPPFRAFTEAMSKAVIAIYEGFSCFFLIKTTATKRTLADIGCCSDYTAAALAGAQPHGIIGPGFVGTFNNCQTSKFKSLKLKSFTHESSPVGATS